MKGLIGGLALIVVSLLAQPAAEAASGGREFLQLRSLGYSLMTNLLLYYNPVGAPYDPTIAAAGKQNLALMKQISTRLQNPELDGHMERLEKSVGELSNLPQSVAEARSVIPPYPLWLIPVVEEFVTLERWLSERDVEVQGEVAELEALRHDIERLSFSYQMAAFQTLGSDVWVLDDTSVAQLDSSILQRLELLSIGDDDHLRLRRDYRFVRGQFLDASNRRMPNGVARYVERITTRLGRLAAR